MVTRTYPPYYELKDAGYSIDIASIQDGIAPIDPGSYDDKDEHNNRFFDRYVDSTPVSALGLSTDNFQCPPSMNPRMVR